jgi:hypothetical protein
LFIFPSVEIPLSQQLDNLLQKKITLFGLVNDNAKLVECGSEGKVNKTMEISHSSLPSLSSRGVLLESNVETLDGRFKQKKRINRVIKNPIWKKTSSPY